MKRRLNSLVFFIVLLSTTMWLQGVSGPVVFFTDTEETPGSIYYLSGGQDYPFFTATSGMIYYAAFGNDGVLYYSNANQKTLYRVLQGQAEPIYQHTTYIRDIAVDLLGRVYFSEASGAGQNGIIYRLEDGVARLYYTVNLANVGGYWSGNFAFAPDGVLYLSTGNKIDSYIYKIFQKNLLQVYHDPVGCIGGFDIDKTGLIYYADWANHIYKLNPVTGVRESYRGDRSRRFVDAALVKHYIAMGPEVGRVYRVAVNPDNPQIVYAGTGSGGIFRSYDGGSTWYLRSNDLTNPKIGGLLVYPPNPTTILVANNSGIFRSIDSGLSWAKVLEIQEWFPPISTIPSRLYTMSKSPIRYDDTTGTIYAAPWSGGLFKSCDGGETWQQIYGENIPEQKLRIINDIEIAPENGGTLFIATLDGIHKYNGSTWSLYGTEIVSSDPDQHLSPVCIKVYPHNPERIYVTASDLEYSPRGTDIWRRDSINGQFYRVVEGTPIWSPNEVMSALEASPTTPEKLWMGGVSPYTSIDGGKKWVQYYDVPGCSDNTVCGIDYWDMVFDQPGNRLYAAHDQGIFQFDFNTNSIRAVEKGLINTQIYDLDIGPGGTIYIGTQDRGAFRKKPGCQWEKIDTEDNGDVLNIIANPNDDSRLFYWSNDSKIFIGSNYGSTITFSSTFYPTGFWNHTLVYIPSENTIYAGTQSNGVYKSVDGGINFYAVNNGIVNKMIRCIGNIPGNSQVLYIGTEYHEFYKTVNGGNTWQRLPNFPNTCKALVIKPMSDGNTVYVGTSDGLYVSVDGGNTWTTRNNGLPARKVIGELVIDPSCPTCFYAGLGYYSTQGLYGGGIYRSNDEGLTWNPFTTEKMQHMSVTAIRFDPQNPAQLWIATYGSGVITMFKDN